MERAVGSEALREKILSQTFSQHCPVTHCGGGDEGENKADEGGVVVCVVAHMPVKRGSKSEVFMSLLTHRKSGSVVEPVAGTLLFSLPEGLSSKKKVLRSVCRLKKDCALFSADFLPLFLGTLFQHLPVKIF